MPMWQIYCTQGTFTAAEKAAFAARITKLYVKFVELPRFYVSVIFHELGPHALFVGGEPAEDFVRISIDHIARKLPAELAASWMQALNTTVAPFITEKGLGWEVHIDETPRRYWTIQGLIPPTSGTDRERQWTAENRAF